MVILTFCLASLPFAIARIAMSHDGTLAIWDLPGPCASMVFATGAIFAFVRHTLHPTYSLCIAIFLVLGWVAVLLFSCWQIRNYDNGNNDGEYQQYRYAPTGVLVIKSLCYAVVTATYLVYVGFAAKAIHDLRQRRRQGVLELDDGMGLELVPKKATHA
ncbi:hypothetical protein LTR36_000294 [Oleoguttula mirabilis]|uniref:Uncharacterized protein n=1 Tax=Oleoguttula mirabilis TaxID=1507867 RepID=A0AAV9JYM8_9PEZI|nr:hypothetical protein LTR36_000294 [Oleoguttula mirabilis]